MAQATLGSRLSTRWQVSLSTTQARAAGGVALVALAVGTRFWHITHKSLWLDEILSWQAARVPPSEWADYVGAHPPLYFGLLHLWVNVAGDSEAALRAPSAIAGAATIILLAFVASRVGGVLLGSTAGTPVGQTFGLSGGVTLRRLQVIRTQERRPVRQLSGGTRWILQADGYIQSTHGYSYIDATIPLDADKDGTIDQSFVFVLEYRGSASNQPPVFGLRPGQAFAPVQQDAQGIGSNGEWQTLQIVVAKGERLQPRFFVGKGVLVGRVAFLPAVE